MISFTSLKWLIFVAIFPSTFIHAQVISQFTWESDPVTNADVGPNGATVSGSAYSSAGGVGGTNGLNPRLGGQPKRDINMDIPASPTFDVPGIDISIDFMRNESRGDFVNRGNDLIFGMNGGNLRMSFRLDDGAGGFITVNSGNIYSIPNDNTFRTYRFFYNPSTGNAEVRVNGTTVWTYAGAPGINMYWSAGTLRVGNAMDGSGTNAAIFDNLIIGQVINSPLPVELLSFSCYPQDQHVFLNWETASESNNDYFEVQRSKDGAQFETIGRVEGAGNSNQMLSYEYIDKDPRIGGSYYRLKQVDFDGQYEYTDIRSVDFTKHTDDVSVYPNPSSTSVTVNVPSSFVIYDSKGSVVYKSDHTLKSEISIDVTQWDTGVYFLNSSIGTQKIMVY